MRVKVRNEVRLWTEVHEGVNEMMWRRGLSWYGHCRRMAKERCPSRLLDWEPLGRRKKRGRPRTSWIEAV